MIEERSLTSWEEFEAQIRELELTRKSKDTSSTFLYRGQDNNTYELSSTLERIGKEKLSLFDYHRLIYIVKPQIESFTGKNWDILSFEEGIARWLSENDTWLSMAFGQAPFQKTYSYMIYLRHYGFPSPLLDWTVSPYIAAYFAFKKASNNAKCVSIYAYLESDAIAGMKGTDRGESNIELFGPYVNTDRRHYQQKSWYMICIEPDQHNIDNNNKWRYASYKEIFNRNIPNQDLLWKFNIPYSERLKVLRLLDRYKINSYSLFTSEESLMETLSIQEIELRRID